MILGLSSPVKPRGATATSTPSGKPATGGTNKTLTPGGSVGRRSTISYDAKAASNEKTNLAVGDNPRLVTIIDFSIQCN